MIDGLKLTIPGEKLRTLLDARIQDHEQRAARWADEQERTPAEETEEAPLLPEHMCRHEEERHAWRGEVLRFIRDHIEAGETYRLGPADVEFGELLPSAPASVAQEEYEERSRIGFALERMTKAIDGAGLLTCGFLAGRDASDAGIAGTPPRQGDQTNDFRTTALDIQDGPEIVVIERE